MLAFDYKLNPVEISFKAITRAPGSLRTEVERTVQLIAGATTKPLAVAFSGGIDSEVICRTLLEQGIKFSVIIMRYQDQHTHNIHDIHWAFKFCDEHKIEPILLDVNIIKFMEHGVRPYVDQGYYSHEIFRYLQLWLMEQASQRGYSLILGGREEPITRNNNCPVVRYDPGHLMCHEWNLHKGGDHYPSFFECTPELMAAYYDDPLLKFVLAEPNYFVPNSRGFSPEKILVYHREWPDLERRPKNNGFERLYSIRDQHQKAINGTMPALENIYIPVQQIRQELGLANLPKIA